MRIKDTNTGKMKMRINDTKAYDVVYFELEVYDMKNKQIKFDVAIKTNDLQNALEYLTKCQNYCWIDFISTDLAKRNCPVKETYTNCELTWIRRERAGSFENTAEEVLYLYFKCPFEGNI